MANSSDRLGLVDERGLLVRLAALSIVLLAFCGACAGLDSFFGLDDTGEDSTGQPGDSPAETVRGLARYIPVYGGAAAGLLGLFSSFYQSMRRKRAGQHVRSVVEGVEGFVGAIRAKQPGEALNVEGLVGALYKAITGASAVYGHRAEFAQLVAAIKAELRGKGAPANPNG